MGQHGKYRPLVRPLARFCAALTALVLAGAAHSECRHALALALDVSGSVDAREYALQLNGISRALDDLAVRRTLLSDPRNHVDLLVYEWSGPKDQAIIVDWISIRTAKDIEIIQFQLSQHTRAQASPGTAIGSALIAGKKLLVQRVACWQRTLDISGDGKSNIGLRPEEAREMLLHDGIVVNALVVGTDHAGRDLPTAPEIGELASYFATRVITGTDAFVETALGYENYAAAMARKLERELRGLSLSALPVAIDRQ